MPFQDAVVTGLAPDGGLLLPAGIPDVSARLARWRDLGFIDLAVELIPLFVDDVPRGDLEKLIREAYATFTHPDVVPLVPVGELTVMELFHGPTLAFKDVALQLLGRLFEYVLQRRGEHLNILAATSGDTGSAAIAGVRGLAEVDIFVMFPDGRVSALQELQMTTVADANVHCLAVDGSFDDCQMLMKTLFAELPFKQRYRLGAVNSVNWARVLAQIVYYGYASLQLGSAAPVTFCVPTGNFGNVFAGYLAKRMGFPIERLILRPTAPRSACRATRTWATARSATTPSARPRLFPGREPGDNAIAIGRLFEGATWKDLIDNAANTARCTSSACFSDGNVHSHIEHLEAMLKEARADGRPRARVHILLDGRDVPPTSALVCRPVRAC
jgi:threonine synthase